MKTPFLNSFFSNHGPTFETDRRPDLGSRVGARRSGARSPDLGSRAGPGLAPPPAGRGRSSSRRCIQARRRALQERRRGRRPPPAVPRRPSPHRPPRLSSPPSAPWRRVGSPLPGRQLIIVINSRTCFSLQQIFSPRSSDLGQLLCKFR
jgi:hypothetical protein